MRITRSRPIAKVFESLGISDDPLGLRRRQGASALIRRLFGSHDNARRVRYLLKELGWVEGGSLLLENT